MFSPEGLYEDAVVMAGWSKGTVSVSDKWNTVFSNYDIEDMEFQQESQGNYVLKVSLSSYSQGSFWKRWRRQTAKEWYLDVRGYRIAKCSLETDVGRGRPVVQDFVQLWGTWDNG